MRVLQSVHLFASGRKLPPTVNTGVPLFGGLLAFLSGPMALLEKYQKNYGEVFSVNLFHKRMTFLVGPIATSHFFRAKDEEISQDEVRKVLLSYRPVVPRALPAVVYYTSAWGPRRSDSYTW